MKKNTLYRMLLLACIVTISSCQKDETVSEEITATEMPSEVPKDLPEGVEIQGPKTAIPNNIQQKLEQLGFEVDENSYAADGAYVVQGDMKLTEEHIDQMLAENNNEQKGEPGTGRHYIVDTVLDVDFGDSGTRKTIKIHIANEFPEVALIKINEAMERFNVLNLMFKFERTTKSSEADLHIVSKWFWGTQGLTDLPQNGKIGKKMELSYWDYVFGGNILNTKNMTTVVAHELGHAIGFRHMDYKKGESCSGTAPSEAPGEAHNPVSGTGDDTITTNSWMLACIGNRTNRPFVMVDKIALYNLFGRNRLAGDAILLRYNGKNGLSHYYTTYYQWHKEGDADYYAEGFMGRLFTTSRNNSSLYQPLYNYYNSSRKDHYYTITKRTDGTNGYYLQGIAGYVWKNSSSNRLVIYQFYNPSSKQHFYTTNGAEFRRLDKGNTWTYQGKQGYLEKVN